MRFGVKNAEQISGVRIAAKFVLFAGGECATLVLAGYSAWMAISMTTNEAAPAEIVIPVIREYIAVKPGYCGGSIAGDDFTQSPSASYRSAPQRQPPV